MSATTPFYAILAHAARSLHSLSVFQAGIATRLPEQSEHFLSRSKGNRDKAWEFLDGARAVKAKLESE